MAVLSVASPLLLVLANFLFAHQNPHNFFSFMGLGALGLFCFLMTFFAAGTFLFSLISIIKLSFNKLSDSEFLVNETLFKDNKAVKLLSQTYNEIYNVILSVALYDSQNNSHNAEQLHEKIVQLKELKNDVIYNQTILEKNNFDDLPNEIQEKVKKKQTFLADLLKNSLVRIHCQKLYNVEAFQTQLEKLNVETKMERLENVLTELNQKNELEKKKETQTIAEIEKEALEKINQMNGKKEDHKMKKSLSI